MRYCAPALCSVTPHRRRQLHIVASSFNQHTLQAKTTTIAVWFWMVCWAAVCDKHSPTDSLLNWRTNKRLFSILYAIFFPDAIRWVGLTNEEVLELFLLYHTMKWPWILLDLAQQPCPAKPFCPAKINRSLLTLIVLLLNTNSPFILCALIVSSAHPRDAIIRLIHNIALSIPSDPSHDNRQQNSGEKKIIATTSFEECE